MPDETLGERLRRLRLSRGLTLRWVEKESGVKNSTIVFLEHNRSDPRAATVKALADVYGMTMDELYLGIGRGERCASLLTSEG